MHCDLRVLLFYIYATMCYSSGAWLTWTGQFFAGVRTSLHQLQTPAPCTSWSYPEHKIHNTMQHSNLNIKNNGASHKQWKCQTSACVSFIVFAVSSFSRLLTRIYISYAKKELYTCALCAVSAAATAAVTAAVVCPLEVLRQWAHHHCNCSETAPFVT